MQSPASDPSPAPITDGPRRTIGGDPAARLARTGVRALAIAASLAIVGGLVAAVLAISGGDAVTAAAVIVVVVAVLLGVLAGYLLAALRAHGRTGSDAAGATRSEAGARPLDADRGEVVTDDEIESARALFGEGAGPARVDPSWPR